MCGDWHALHREMIVAYDRVPDELGDAYEAAQAEAEAALRREHTLYDQIAEIAPTLVAGIIAQASVAAAALQESYALDKGYQHADDVVINAYLILSNIASFGGSSAGTLLSHYTALHHAERLAKEPASG
jgi:hypothetical protein